MPAIEQTNADEGALLTHPCIDVCSALSRIAARTLLLTQM